MLRNEVFCIDIIDLLRTPKYANEMTLFKIIWSRVLEIDLYLKVFLKFLLTFQENSANYFFLSDKFQTVSL